MAIEEFTRGHNKTLESLEPSVTMFLKGGLCRLERVNMKIKKCDVCGKDIKVDALETINF